MPFSEQQKTQLSDKLDPSVVKQRQGLSYIEGWHAIAEANRIFGFGEWTRETVKLTMVREDENSQNKWNIAYVAVVRVTVFPPEGPQIIREGTGYGDGLGMKAPGAAHEAAVKEAETDAMKRALMTFGNPFGLALYDKAQENVGIPGAIDPPIDEDNPPDPNSAPDKQTGKKWKFVTAAQEQKLRAGPEAYYQVLNSFEMEKATDIKADDTKAMNEVIKALKALADKEPK
jgi:DNA recombination protein Rad52